MRPSLTFGLAALAGLSGCTAQHGSQLTVPSGGVHRLADGGCIDFARLPAGWEAVPQASIHDEAAIRGQVQGIPVTAAIHTDGLYTDVYAPTVIGWQRLPEQDSDGFTAWRADDGELVLSDGNRKTYQVIIECVPQSARLHLPATCHVSDHHLSKGRLLEVHFDWSNLRHASVLIRRTEQAAALLSVTCPT